MSTPSLQDYDQHLDATEKCQTGCGETLHLFNLRKCEACLGEFCPYCLLAHICEETE